MDTSLPPTGPISNPSSTAANAARKPRIWPLVAMVIVFWAFYCLVGVQDLSISQTFMAAPGPKCCC